MLNRSASLAMSTSVLKALPGKLDIKRHSPSILYLLNYADAQACLRLCCSHGSSRVAAQMQIDSWIQAAYVAVML